MSYNKIFYYELKSIYVVDVLVLLSTDAYIDCKLLIVIIVFIQKGYDNLDLLKSRDVLPGDGVQPPEIKLPQGYANCDNCSPEYDFKFKFEFNII